jgi:hypothetical protein
MAPASRRAAAAEGRHRRAELERAEEKRDCRREVEEGRRREKEGS